MVASAEVAYLARRAREYGVKMANYRLTCCRARTETRNSEEVARREREKPAAGGTGGSDLRRRLIPRRKQVRVRLNDGGERTLTADLIVIDTGLTADKPPIPGLESVPYLDNTSIMELDELPGHLLVLGGGYVGLEFAPDVPPLR